MQDGISTRQFEEAMERWYPLIYRGAIEYAVPGRLDVCDLTNEGLLLLYTTIQEKVMTLNWWELTSTDFSKYFKSALFHMYIDRKRSHMSGKRNYRKELHATEDYDPLDGLTVKYESPEDVVIGDQLVDLLRKRLSPTHQRVLDAWLNPPEWALERMRSKVLKCVNASCDLDEYETSGVETSCPNCGSSTRVVRASNPSKVKQECIQEITGLKRGAVTESIAIIRSVYKNLECLPDPRNVDLTTFLEALGFGSYENPETGEEENREILIASCRFEDGNPEYTPLTYQWLCIALNDAEQRVLNFFVLHNTEDYQVIRFQDAASRLSMKVHDLRQIVDTIRIKIEMIDAGVPIRDIPRNI